MEKLQKLREEVFRANIDLLNNSLVILTWGNVSGIDREKGLVVIKPSGVEYDRLSPSDMVVVDLEGNVREGSLRPSSDTPTHLELYRAFPAVGGIVHTHSAHATSWAQACRPIPVFGTTHADHFYGQVPCTRRMRKDEVEVNYETNTGRIIVETMKGIDPLDMPAILVASHGPFTWGRTASDALHNAVVLEETARMALMTVSLGGRNEIDKYLLDKHFLRKHGKDAYYGQK
ncbi:MAG: L-ribulose-5-phosphate 4-epimerase [Bacteroidales bacterium]|jgi:L-ribulose-5-phosphate 4-epimerase|nr:L-ribulose-5-phosphate 4-epimerase [Bacteroidales bacterium]